MRRFAGRVTAAVVLFAAVRWSIFAALRWTDPETASDLARLFFGPAGLGNEFPRLFLPSLESPLRFAAGELAWSALAAAAVWLVSVVFQRRS